MQPTDFEILSELTEIETIAVNRSIRELKHLNRTYGKGRWRKCKAIVMIRYNGTDITVMAELHWYEAHGIGKVKWKVKQEI